jgi:uncharacterized membrane protein YkoI
MITGSEAVEIARARALEKGWGFAEPIQTLERRAWSGAINRYEIETNAGGLGTKARFVIDAKTGAILSEGYVPR